MDLGAKVKYDSKKNIAYKHIFNYLSENHANYTLKESNKIYYVFIYDILMLKYKLLAIFKILKFHKLNKEELDDLIYHGRLESIQDRKEYYSFFENITEEKQISGYIYKQLSVDNKTNPTRYILNYRNENKPDSSYSHNLFFLPNTLEKSAQILSFHSFKLS